MIEILLLILMMIALNLKISRKWELYSTTIVFNNIFSFFVVAYLYLSYFNNEISGTTFICSLITLILIYVLLLAYKRIQKQKVFLVGYIISVIPLLFILYSEIPILKYEKLDYHVTVYIPTEELNNTQVSILGVGSVKIDKKEEQNLTDYTILNKNKIANIERYLNNSHGIFYEYFGGNKFNESLNNAELLVGTKTKTIEQIEKKPNAEGDSAGLAMTLGSYIELQTLSNKVPVAVTGAIDSEANVMAVGSIEEKVMISLMDGFEYMIVPSVNYEEAQRTLDKLNKKLSIIPVSTVNDAKLALEDINNQ